MLGLGSTLVIRRNSSLGVALQVKTINSKITRLLSSSSCVYIQLNNLERAFPPNVNEGGKSGPCAKDYSKLCTWKDREALVRALYDNVVYHEPETDPTGLVVINKPYGLSLKETKDSPYCLSECLASLADKLAVEKLIVLKSAERFSSGITVLGTSNATADAYKKSIGRLATTRTLSTSYLALVKGQPNLNIMESVDRKMVDCPDVSKPLFGSMHKEPVVSRQLVSSSNAFKNKIKRIHVAVNTLAKSSLGATVVEISPSSTGKHFLPVYLADLGHPLLGDQMYDYRARTLMGHRVKLSTGHTNARRAQILPSHLLDALGLSKGEEWLVPKMLHLHRMFLPAWLGTGKDLTVYAPPPTHWTKTCTVLAINFNYKEVAEKDGIKQWKTRLKNKKEGTEMTEADIVETDLSSHVAQLV